MTESLLMPEPTGTSLLAPQTRPSISMVLTALSIATMSVSSSQGLQSSNTEVLAMRAGFFGLFGSIGVQPFLADFGSLFGFLFFVIRAKKIVVIIIVVSSSWGSTSRYV